MSRVTIIRSITTALRKSAVDAVAIKLLSSSFSTSEKDAAAKPVKKTTTESKKKAKGPKTSSNDAGDLDNVVKFYETIQTILKYET